MTEYDNSNDCWVIDHDPKRITEYLLNLHFRDGWLKAYIIKNLSIGIYKFITK